MSLIDYIQVTVDTPSCETPLSRTLDDADGRVARMLLGGHAPSIASAILANEATREAVFTHFLNSINQECSVLCKTSVEIPKMRHINADELADFQWECMRKEMELKAPLLLKVLTTIAVRNDHRNRKKVGSSHLPGICTAAAVLLKERNCHMCGLQKLVS